MGRLCWKVARIVASPWFFLATILVSFWYRNRSFQCLPEPNSLTVKLKVTQLSDTSNQLIILIECGCYI